MTTGGRLASLATILTLAAVAPRSADAATFEQGRYSLGVSGGGGRSTANIGLGFGYMVVDGLQPSISVGYRWVGADYGDSHQVETKLELRYYIWEFTYVAPFIYVNGSHVFLAFRGTPTEDHNFFRAGGGAGLAFMISRGIAFTINFGASAWLGADQSLYDR